MFINKKNGASYGFVAPEIEADKGKDVKVPFPTFGRVEARKVEDHLEADVKRTHTVVGLGEIDELPVVDFKTDMLGEIPIIRLVAKPNEDLPDGSRLTVLLDLNSDLYPQTSMEKDEDDKNRVHLGLVGLALSTSDDADAPTFICVIPSASDFIINLLNSVIGDDQEVAFQANPVPVNFVLMQGQWVPAETIVGLASVQTTVNGFHGLIDEITATVENNNSENDDDDHGNGGASNEDSNNGDTDNGGTGTDDPTNSGSDEEH